jgi:hypothetical protein
VCTGPSSLSRHISSDGDPIWKVPAGIYTKFVGTGEGVWVGVMGVEVGVGVGDAASDQPDDLEARDITHSLATGFKGYGVFRLDYSDGGT